MKNRRFAAMSAALTLTLAAAFSTCGSDAAYASGLPVKESHPRIMLDSTWKSRLVAKKNANEATWTTLKNRADLLKNWPIQQYTYATRGYWYSNKLFYGFQGSQWYEDAFSLAMAYQITGDTAYSTKAIQLAQEIIRAENDPANAPVQNPWGTSYRNPFAIDFSYASRYVGPAMAIIYDWCYAAIPPALRAQMVTQMNAFYLHLRTSPNYTTYERQGPSTGNFFGSHLYCAAMMGYATYGDNQQAQSMIDWARIRFDGTQSSLLSGQDIPTSNRVQAFEGPFPSRFETQTNVNPNLYKGKPAKGGFNVQGWAYGTNEYARQIDYMLMVRSATGENLFNQYGYWYNDMFRSMKHALLPNRIGIDPVADWGGNQGAVVDRRLPLRLGYVLENTPDSAAAYHFAHVEIPQNTGWGAYYTDVTIYAAPAWENFLFKMTGKSAQAGDFPKYFSPFGNGYPQGGTTNGAVARFITRTSWDTTATWLCAEMGGAFYGDHHHYQAGHIYLSRGKYPLLISPGNYRGTSGMGLMGSSVGDYITMSAMKNTLFFDDWGVYNRYESVYQVGGQGRIGDDRIIAAWQDNGLTYVRSDLSTAYNNDEWPRSIRDTAQRTLEQFYRTVAYLNAPNIAVVFDRIKAKNSTHARGQYEKHLRWHVPTQPVINGNTATVRNGNSKLHITTLLPENQTITPVALNPNPDNHYSGMSYLFNSPVWRVEVREQGNPLESDWLTILQTGDTTTAVAFSQAIMDNQFTMKGAQFVVNGKNYYVLFNDRTGATPSPIDMTSYSIDGGESHHVLGGLYPSAAYNVAWSNGTVVVTLDATGAYTTNAAGVLEFDIPTGSIKTTGNTAAEAAQAFAATVSPNPAADVLRVSFTLPDNAAHVRVTLADALGVTIAVLHDGAMNTGSYSLESDVASVSSGAYYCTIETAAGRTVIPVTIVR